MEHLYLAFGLTVASPLELPDLVSSSASPDVVFRFAMVDRVLAESSRESLVGYARPGKFLMAAEGVGNFLVQDGNEVLIDPVASASSDLLILLLMGPVMGVLLHQRGLLPLHGSAVLYGQHPILFLGHSATGKSTLAAVFLQRNHTVLCDEICAMDTSGVRLLPGLPFLCLWQDAVSRLKLGTRDLRRVRPGLEKFRLPTRSGDYAPARVGSCYVLERHNREDLRIEPLDTFAKIAALIEHIFRRSVVAPLGRENDALRQVCAMAASARLSRVKYPFGRFTAQAVADAIERDLTR